VGVQKREQASVEGEGPTTTVSSKFVAAMEVQNGFMNSCRFVVDLTSTAKDLDRDQDGSPNLDPAQYRSS
jgi:hypothetical protein